MRPSLTTIATMTVAAGTIALVGGLASSTASAQVEMVENYPVIEVLEMPVDGEYEFVVDQVQPEFVPLGGEIDEVTNWFDGDSCPPCGMG